MTLADIIDSYSNLQNNYHNVYSTFSICSAFGKPKTPFVLNNADCINFDTVKKDLRLELKSVDSLYLSIPNNAAYFIEFKNSHYDNVHQDIVEKAKDSIIIHHQVCKFSSYSFVKNDIVCVLSEYKTMSNTNNLLSAYLKASGYMTNPQYLAILEKKFEQSFLKNVVGTNLPFVYDSFKIIFDTSFDNFVASF